MLISGTSGGWLKKKRQRNKVCSKSLIKDEKEYAPSKGRVCLDEEDSADDTIYSDEESFDGLDYENAHLAFDPEKSPKL